MNIEQLEALRARLCERLSHLEDKMHFQNDSIENIRSEALKDEGDIVSANIQAELDLNLAQKFTKEISLINASLRKMEDNTYGICEMCDSDIDPARLNIKLHAKYCITCREIYEQERAK